MDARFTYNNIELAYAIEGEGDTIVLLHGWGCDHTIWQATTDLLKEHFRVIAVDFAGFGQSNEPQEVWGVEEYTQSIEALLSSLGVVRPTLCGHSFGGRVSILYASRNEVARVVLTDAAGVKPKRSLNYYRKVYTFKLLKRLLPLLVGKTRATEIIERRRAKAGSSDYSQATPMMRAILSKVVNEDLCHLMPKIKAPTLLFWGERDTATPLADAKRMEQLIPDAGLVTVAGAGHFSFLENTPLFLRVVESFLGKEMKR